MYCVLKLAPACPVWTTSCTPNCAAVCGNYIIFFVFFFVLQYISLKAVFEILVIL